MCWRPAASLDETLRFDALGWHVGVNAAALHVAFKRPQRVISSAVFNGGVHTAQHFINLKVDMSCPLKPVCPLQAGGDDPIADAFHAYLIPKDINPNASVGMMTAASMLSTRVVHTAVDDAELIVLLSSGLANVRRAGDVAEHRQLDDHVAEVGTINIVFGVSRPLNDAAMVEAHSIITEAKCAVLQERGILSPVSNEIATGTGTDACAVIAPQPQDDINNAPIRFCGKHTLLGEQLARAVMGALHDSLDYQATPQ